MTMRARTAAALAILALIVFGVAAVPAATAPRRIVSLAPNLTEDVFAVGAGGALVGVDAYSNRPAAALRVRRIGALREVNDELVLALHPDLVVGIAYQAPQLADLARAGLSTHVIAVDTLRDDLAAIATIGVLTHRRRQADAVVHAIRRRLAATSARARLERRLRAFVVIGAVPIYTAGRASYIGDLLKLANLANVAGALSAAWPRYSAERLVADDPDVIVLPRATVLPDAEPWNRLRAVRESRIIRIDDDLLLRPGPEVAGALDALVVQAERWRRGTTIKPPASSRTSIATP